MNVLRKETLLPKDADYYTLATFFKIKDDSFMEIYDNKISDDQVILTNKNMLLNAYYADIVTLQKNIDKVKQDAGDIQDEIDDQKNLIQQRKKNLKKNEAYYTRKAIINQYTDFRDKKITILSNDGDEDELKLQKDASLDKVITKREVMKKRETLKSSRNMDSINIEKDMKLMIDSTKKEENNIKDENSIEEVPEGSCNSEQSPDTINQANLKEKFDNVNSKDSTQNKRESENQSKNTPSLTIGFNKETSNAKNSLAKEKSGETSKMNSIREKSRETLQHENTPQEGRKSNFKELSRRSDGLATPRVHETTENNDESGRPNSSKPPNNRFESKCTIEIENAEDTKINKVKSLEHINSGLNTCQVLENKIDTKEPLPGYNIPTNTAAENFEFDIYENDDEYFKMKTKFNKMVSKQENKERLTTQYKNDIENKYMEISMTEKEIANLKKEVKKGQKAQIEFLIKVVKSGHDNRNDGIVWALQKIKKFGGIITEDHLPEYLDDRSKLFLMNKLNIYEDLLEKESLHSFYWDIFKSFVGEKQGTKEELDDEKFLLANNQNIKKRNSSQRNARAAVAFLRDQKKIQQDSYCSNELLSKYEDMSRAESKNPSYFYGKGELSLQGYDPGMSSEYKNALVSRNIKSNYRQTGNGVIVNKLSMKEPSVHSMNININPSTSQITLNHRLRTLGESLEQGFDDLKTLPKIRQSWAYPTLPYIKNMQQGGVNLQNQGMELRQDRLPIINEARVNSAKNPIINRNFDIKKGNNTEKDERKVSEENIEKKIVEEDQDVSVRNNDLDRSASVLSVKGDLDQTKEPEVSNPSAKLNQQENTSANLAEMNKNVSNKNSSNEKSQDSKNVVSNRLKSASKEKSSQKSLSNKKEQSKSKLVPKKRTSTSQKIESNPKQKAVTNKNATKDKPENKNTINKTTPSTYNRKQSIQKPDIKKTNISSFNKIKDASSEKESKREFTPKNTSIKPEFKKGETLKKINESGNIKKPVFDKTPKSRASISVNRRPSILKEKPLSKPTFTDAITTPMKSNQNPESNLQSEKQDLIKDTDRKTSEEVYKDTPQLETIDDERLDFKKKDHIALENFPRNNRIDSAPAYPVKIKEEEENSNMHSLLEKDNSFSKLPKFDNLNLSSIAPEYSEFYLNQKEMSEHYLSYINSKPLFILDQNFKLESKEDEPSKINNSEKCFKIGNRIMDKMVKKMKSREQEKVTDPFQMNILFFDGNTCINDFKSRKEFLQKEIDLELYIDEKRTEISVLDEEEIQRVTDEYKRGKANMTTDFGTYMSVLVGYQKTHRIISDARNDTKYTGVFE